MEAVEQDLRLVLVRRHVVAHLDGDDVPALVRLADHPLAHDARVGREPLVDQNNPESNVKAKLPSGQQVTARTGQTVNGFLEVDTNFQGQPVHGFAAAKFLAKV